MVGSAHTTSTENRDTDGGLFDIILRPARRARH